MKHPVEENENVSENTSAASRIPSSLAVSVDGKPHGATVSESSASRTKSSVKLALAFALRGPAFGLNIVLVVPGSSILARLKLEVVEVLAEPMSLGHDVVDCDVECLTSPHEQAKFPRGSSIQ